MVAAIGDYFVWWQGLILLAMLIVWFIGGGLLLWVGGRFAAKIPKATLGRSFAANILASLAGLLVMIPISASVMVIGPLGSLLGWAGGLVITWLVIKGMFRTSFGKAILAWLPTIPVGIITVALLVSILLPTLGRAKELAKRAICGANLRAIGSGIAIYQAEHDEQYPPNLDALIENGQPKKLLKCPSSGSNRNSPGSDYFYLCPAQDANPQTIVACDFRNNHRGAGRNVLFEDGRVKWLSEADFQAELAKPHNAAFAKVLREADRTD